MLGKLIKYDLLYNWKLYLGVMAVLLVWGVMGSPSGGGITLTLNLVLLPVLFAAGVLCVVSVLRYYSKALYGRQGYLTMTLPTSTASVLGSKVITTILWFNAVLLVAVFSALLYVRELNGVWPYLSEQFGELLLFAVLLNLSALNTLLTIYLAITIANVSINGRRLGFLGGLAGYLVWTLVQNLTESLVLRGDTAFSGMFGVVLRFMGAAASSATWLQLLYYAAFAAAGYCINLYLIKKKVSLQ